MHSLGSHRNILLGVVYLEGHVVLRALSCIVGAVLEAAGLPFVGSRAKVLVVGETLPKDIQALAWKDRHLIRPKKK